MAKSYKSAKKRRRKKKSGFLHKEIKLSFKVKIPLIIIIAAVLIFGNFTLCVTEYTYSSDKLPQSFDGYRIAQVSDFHNTKNKFICDALIKSLSNEKPDLIIITGDFIDGNTTDVDYALEYAERFCKIAPCYYVTGNHEINYSILQNDDYTRFIQGLAQSGVTVLSCQTAEIKNGDDTLYINGIDDLYKRGQPLDKAADILCGRLQPGDSFNILLAHQPQELDMYSKYGFDLVFCGHAHGGQLRLFGRGLYAPDQGFLPDYTSGIHTAGGTAEIVSRGIGNSVFPIRIFDRPELVYCTLKLKG